MKAISKALLLPSFAFILIGSSAASAPEENNFEDIQKKYPNATEVLTDKNLTEAEAEELEDLSKKIEEDMAENPDKVMYATPVGDKLF